MGTESEKPTIKSSQMINISKEKVCCQGKRVKAGQGLAKKVQG